MFVASGVLGHNSVILKDEEEFINQIEEWMNELCKWRLCYRATKDRWTAEDFHSCCDNNGPTVTFVKVGKYSIYLVDTQTRIGKANSLRNFRYKTSLPAPESPKY